MLIHLLKLYIIFVCHYQQNIKISNFEPNFHGLIYGVYAGLVVGVFVSVGVGLWEGVKVGKAVCRWLRKRRVDVDGEYVGLRVTQNMLFTENELLQ